MLAAFLVFLVFFFPIIFGGLITRIAKVRHFILLNIKLLFISVSLLFSIGLALFFYCEYRGQLYGLYMVLGPRHTLPYNPPNLRLIRPTSYQSDFMLVYYYGDEQSEMDILSPGCNLGKIDGKYSYLISILDYGSIDNNLILKCQTSDGLAILRIEENESDDRFRKFSFIKISEPDIIENICWNSLDKQYKMYRSYYSSISRHTFYLLQVIVLLICIYRKRPKLRDAAV